MPDLSAGNVRFRAWFYAHWGRENCIILGSSKNVEYGKYRQRLSVKMANGGGERYFIDNRTLVVDDDSYLVLNDERDYSSVIRAERSVESFSVFFRTGLMEEVMGAMGASIERVTEPSYARAVEFPERLQPHDTTVSPVMRFIRHHIRSGVDDEAWYEEQLHVLAAKLLVQQRRVRLQTLRLECARPATRIELCRRLALAADFILSNYERDLRLEQMAAAACLSAHHFMRLFRAVYGVTPTQFLYRKRVQAALHLQCRSSLPLQEIASRVGFNSRATFYRQLRRWQPVVADNSTP
ncbi:MAG TPA: AraC family transcriptional regulator [Povalibacter sp.]